MLPFVIVAVLVFLVILWYQRKLLPACGCAVFGSLACLIVIGMTADACEMEGVEAQRGPSGHQRGEERGRVPSEFVGTWKGRFTLSVSPGGPATLRISIGEGKVGANVAELLSNDRSGECQAVGRLESAHERQIVLRAEPLAAFGGRCDTAYDSYTLRVDQPKEAGTTPRVWFRGERLQKVTPPTKGPDASAVVGTWRGTYVCSQGKTGVTLTIRSAGGERLKAVKKFYPTPDNPAVSHGSYTQLGVLRSGRLTLVPDRWIDRPEGYRMLGISADVTQERPRLLKAGYAGSGNCSDFTLTR